MKTSHLGVLVQFARLWPALLAAVVLLPLTVGMPPSTASASLVRTASWGGDLDRRVPIPRALAYDSLGRVYVTDSGTGRVVRIEADGSIDHSWNAGEPSGVFERPNPSDIAIDGDDNVYLLDSNHWKVRKFSPDGVPLTSWAVTPGFDDSLNGITAEAGSVFVVTNSLVRRFTPEGELIDWWGGFDTVYWYVKPLIRGDGDGNLLVTGSVLGAGNKTATKTIYRFEPDGDLIEKWATPAEVFTRWVQYEDYDVEEVYDIEGYTSLAPRSDGTVWTTTEDNFITRYGPAGQIGSKIGEQGNGVVPHALATSPADELLYAWLEGGDYGTRGLIRKLDATNAPTGEWATGDFPKYADNDRLEGRFHRADDLAVRSDGTVAGYDPFYTRAQFFDGDGGFVDLIDGPDFPQSPDWLHGVAMVLPENGGVDIVNKQTRELFRYDGSGTLFAERELGLGGMMQDLTADPGGGYVAVTATGAGSANIHFLDQEGTATADFKTVGAPDIGDYSGSRVETDSAGRIYFSGIDLIEKYARSGERLRAWNAPKFLCRDYLIDDIATGSDGSVYAIALRGSTYFVLKFDPDLGQLWEEPVGTSEEETPAKGFLDVAPDDAIYVDIGRGIEKFDQSEASAQPLVPLCPQPQVRTMRVERVVYLRGRTAAMVKVRVYEKGRLFTTGRAVVGSSRRATGSGSYWLKVRLKPRFVRLGKPRRLRRVPVRVSFKGPTRSDAQTVSLHLRARLKPSR